MFNPVVGLYFRSVDVLYAASRGMMNTLTRLFADVAHFYSSESLAVLQTPKWET